MLSLTSKYQHDKLEFIKNPVIAEFLGISKDTSYLESDLEQFIIDNLQKFIMELGKGYAFVGRQQHIKTEEELRAEIETQKTLFYLQQQEKGSEK